MNEPVKISDNEKWKAVESCDSNYDGTFFYGVRTTGIFCRPSCKSKTPVQGNATFFNSAASAMAAGFRPCKRCCPDKIVFEPDSELINKVKVILEADYNNKVDLQQISKQLGVSTNHLIKIFKRHNSFTPTQYLIKIRINKASELLNQTDISILEIAYMTGFKSLSNFYKCFTEQTGRTPNECRKGRGDL